MTVSGAPATSSPWWTSSWPSSPKLPTRPGCEPLCRRPPWPTGSTRKRSDTQTRWREAVPHSSNASPSWSARRTSCSIDSSSNPDSPQQSEGATSVAVRVVIAEDEAIIRLDLKEILQEQGYEVVGETGRGDEAISLVNELKPDLAILDIRMPGVDGLAAAREIAGERKAAVLILTAYSQRDLIEEARDAGALAYIVKPFQASEVIPAIEVALGRFQELKAIADQVESLSQQLETR